MVGPPGLSPGDVGPGGPIGCLSRHDRCRKVLGIRRERFPFGLGSLKRVEGAGLHAAAYISH